MPKPSRFSAQRTTSIPSARNNPTVVSHDYRGLDKSSPYDLIEKGRTPNAKNFRLFSDDTEGRQISISTRKGHGKYAGPYEEVEGITNTSTAGQAGQSVGIVLNWRAMHFTPSAAGRLSAIELNLRRGTGSGYLLVDIYTDNAGFPGVKIAESSIAPADIDETFAYASADFIEAPLLVGGTKYWVVAHVQEDGISGYEWASNTTTATSLASNANISGFGSTAFSLNYKTHLTPNYVEKGIFRFARQAGVNKTLVAYNTSMFVIDDVTGAATAIATGLSASATEYMFAIGDGKVFWVNGYDTLRAWNGTTVETITDADLPVLSKIVMHKDRLWGVVAADPNKMVFSENPGNPSNVAANLQWYYAWLSVSFVYVPAPKHGDPITAISSFQDTLTIFTNTSKYNLYGSDRGSLNLHQATGTKGALSQWGTYTDENFIYFVAPDGLYRYNGSSDELISEKVQPIFEKIKFPANITVAKWKRQVRFYFGAGESTVNTDCLLYHTVFEEWQHDTEVYVKRAIYWSDGDDDKRLIESSSLIPRIYNAEQDYNSLGKPIDFAYWTKYDSMGGPAQKKRMLKYYPLIQGVGKEFIVNIDMDKDFANNPVKNQIELYSAASEWDDFNWGESNWGGDTTYSPSKLRYPGYAYYWQMRIHKKAVNNPVMFFGVQYSYKAKRL